MPQLRRAHLAAMCCFTIVAAGALSSAFAGKPQPPPPNPFLIYEWRPDLGGWLDTQTNLVWGYSFWDLQGTSTGSGYAIPQWLAADAAANYADMLYQRAYEGLPASADQTEAHADWQVEQGDIALANGDPELAADWYAAAEANYARAQYEREVDIPNFEAAADVASQFTWRLPTQQEGQRALDNGLFTYGPNGFDSYDASPHGGFQLLFWSGAWSSTTRRNGREAWTYRQDGSTSWATVNSTYNAIFVRTHVP